MKKIVIFLVCISLSFLSFTEKENKSTTTHQDKNIVEVVFENGHFSTLLAAVKAAELAEILSGESQFTVFAPSNAAFDKLPSGTVASLLKSENKDALVDLLLYHVVAGKYNTTAIVKAIKDHEGTFSIHTVKGKKITFIMDGNNVLIKDATGRKSIITMTDVDASNGVIHAIDTVLMPQD